MLESEQGNASSSKESQQLLRSEVSCLSSLDNVVVDEIVLHWTRKGDKGRTLLFIQVPDDWKSGLLYLKIAQCLPSLAIVQFFFFF